MELCSKATFMDKISLSEVHSKVIITQKVLFYILL